MTIFHTIPEAPLTLPSSVAVGVFDGVHIGHQQVIRRARADGLQTVVLALEGCGKGVPRLMMQRDKAHFLDELGADVLCAVDLSALHALSPEAFVEDILCKQLHAKQVVCGFNFHFGKDASGSADDMRRLCNARGIRSIVVPAVQSDGCPVSSSRIRSLMQEGAVSAASALLGRPYCFTLPVTGGDQRGRTLGAPTINQHFPSDFLLPRFGVYASFTEVNGERYPSVTNIGVRPTVLSPFPLAETYLLGFSGDLYGRLVTVSLLEYLRKEQRFDSLLLLKEAIAHDAAAADRIFRELPIK